MAIFYYYSYLQYSIICARAVRNALKPELRVIAQRRDEQGLKFQRWQGGKAGETVSIK
jgi:F-type H+-transporting ATPase subunit epsilon